MRKRQMNDDTAKTERLDTYLEAMHKAERILDDLLYRKVIESAQYEEAYDSLYEKYLQLSQK